MNIAFLTHQFPGARSGGIGSYTLNTASTLANNGFSVHLFTFTLPPDVRGKLPADLHLHEVEDLATRVANKTVPPEIASLMDAGGEAHYRFALATLLCDAVREHHAREKLDILEAPEYEALALPLLLDPPEDLTIAAHLHFGSAVTRAANGITPTEDDALSDALEFAAIQLADTRCAPSRHVFVETSKFTKVPGPAAILVHPLDTPPLGQGLPKDGAILFVGRLEPLKGADLMPAAFNTFLARNPNARIRLAGGDTRWGGGSVRARITAALDPAVRDRVTFLGELSPADVSKEFAACRFSICPSLLEAFGYVAAESMMHSRPVVVSDGIGATEIVSSTGVIFEKGNPAALANAMESLFRDPTLNALLGGFAYNRASTLFDQANTIDKRLAFYEASITHHKEQRAAHAPRPATDVPDRLKNARPTHTPGQRLLALLNQLAPGGGASIHLYGAGRFTLRLLAQRKLFEAPGHRILGLIDDHPRFQNTSTHLGLPITNINALLQRAQAGEKIPPILLSTDTHTQQFLQNTQPLRDLGVQILTL